MHSVQNVTYYITFLFSILIYLNRSQACYHETFKDSTSSKISSECDEYINASPWQFNKYSNIVIQAPSSNETSNGLIMSQALGMYCLASDFILRAVNDSQVSITYFASGTVDLTITFTDSADEDNVVDYDIPMIYDNWTDYNFTLVYSDTKFMIIGIITENSSLLIDSVTYVEPGIDLEFCRGRRSA